MDREEDHHQSRLLLVHEAGGEIEGRAKYHKLIYKLRNEDIDPEIEQILKDRGPFDPGLSETIQRYIDLGLLDVDEENEPHEIRETGKGERYISGYERLKWKIDNRFRETKSAVSEVIREHGDRSASEIVRDEDIQEEKEKPRGEDL